MLTISGIEFHYLEIPLAFFFVTYLLYWGLAGRRSHLVLHDTLPLKYVLWGCALWMISSAVGIAFATDRQMALKSLLKWLEVYAVAFGVFLYAEKRKLPGLWTLSAVIVLLSALPSVVSFARMVWSCGISCVGYSDLRLLPGYSMLFLLAMVAPAALRGERWASVLAILSLGLVVLSATFGVWVGAVSVWGYLYLHSDRLARKKLTWVSIMLWLVGGAVIAGAPELRYILWGKLIRTVTLSSTSADERLGLIQLALQNWLANPVFGIGGENFAAYNFRLWLPYFVHTELYERLSPHNFYLQVLCEFGLVGMIGMACIVRGVWLSWRGSNDDNRTRATGLRALGIAIAITLLFGYVAGSFRLLLAMFLGLSLAQIRKDAPLEQPLGRRRSPWSGGQRSARLSVSAIRYRDGGDRT